MIKQTLLATTLLLSTQAVAGEWEINTGYSTIQHSWTDKRGTTRYTPDMISVGVNYNWDNNISLGYMYGKMDETSDSAGVYPLANIDFDYIHGLELSYRLDVTDWVTLFGGVGVYKIPTNHIWYDTEGDVIGGKEDSDDDEGYFFGADFHVSKNVSLRYKYSHYSNIDDWDEYIRGHGGYLVIRF